MLLVAASGLGALGLVLVVVVWTGDAEVSEATPYSELERQVQRRPSDARAWVLKARLDMQAGRHEMAAQAFGRALQEGREGRKVARDAGVWVEYAEAKGLAQGGSLRGEPQRLLEHALALDGNHPQGLDLAGSAAWESGDYAGAARRWRHLRQLLPGCEGAGQTAPMARCEALERAVQKAEQRARLSLPAAR